MKSKIQDAIFKVKQAKKLIKSKMSYSIEHIEENSNYKLNFIEAKFQT